MRILIVEDDARTAGFLQKGLKQAGFSVECATDGEDGLHRLSSRSFDVAVVDLMLPKLDGLALIGRMRAKGVETPVIILSARSSVE
ncbi:MAG: response regulator, partial [Planctomycetota bacterium]